MTIYRKNAPKQAQVLSEEHLIAALALEQAQLALENLLPIVSDVSSYKQIYDTITTLERDLANLLDIELIALFPETR
jgi:hypothetical protein